jgi:2-amino-4-hydroxy-6-hydroxymethyldihydropteridine diphosphokinase
MPTIAYIGLGSNIGDKKETCLKALELLSETVRVRKVSSFYCTEPVGFHDQEDFINSVAEIETVLAPEQLLTVCLTVEDKLGRRRSARWGPRSIDLDILLYGDTTIETPHLSIPHPLLQTRAFVLIPLCEIAPHVVHPILKKSVAQLRKDLKDPHWVVASDPLEDHEQEIRHHLPC